MPDQFNNQPLTPTNGAFRPDPLGKTSAWYWNGNTFVLDLVAGSNSTDSTDAFMVRAIGPTANLTLFEVLKNGVVKILGVAITAFTLAKSGSTPLTGNVTLTGSGGTSLTQVGQNIDISSTGATGGTPALTLGTTNSAGVSSNFLRDDDTILVFDITVPAAVGTAAVGTAGTAARRDHVHPTGAGTPTTQAFGDSATTGTGPAASMTDHKHGWPALGTTAANIGTSAGGSASTPSKSDHVHATGAGTPTTQAFGDSPVTGTGPAAAMTDHKHGMPATPASGYTQGARVSNNAGQSINDSTSTALGFNTEAYDTDGIHDTVTNNSRLTCKTAGKYGIWANIEWTANSTGTRQMYFFLNGTTIIGLVQVVGQGSGVTTQELYATYSLSINDYVECFVRQTSGGGLQVDSQASYSPLFGMDRVG